MGKADVSLKDYISNRDRFADLFNEYLYDGKEVILPEELEPLDNESRLIFPDNIGKKHSVTRFADIRMKWKKEVVLSILTAEFQDKVHYAMPVRNMILEGLCYTDQMRELWDRIEDEEIKSKLGMEEIFSRFRKEDKLLPVISMVFYYGDDWDGSISLFDMFGFSEEFLEEHNLDVLSKYVTNYKINLFNPVKISDYSVFKTDLQIIFGMLQYKEDKNALRRYISDNEDFFGSISYEAANAAGTLLHSSKWFDKAISKFVNKDKEDCNMCKAIDDMMNDSRQEGRIEGRQEGKIEGKIEGRIEGRILAYYEMGCTVDDIASRMRLSVTEVEDILAI